MSCNCAPESVSEDRLTVKQALRMLLRFSSEKLASCVVRTCVDLCELVA